MLTGRRLVEVVQAVVLLYLLEAVALPVVAVVVLVLAASGAVGMLPACLAGLSVLGLAVLALALGGRLCLPGCWARDHSQQGGILGAINNFFGPGGPVSNALAGAPPKAQQLGNSLMSGAQWLYNRLPFVDTASTKAAKFRDQWSMVGSMLTSATTNQDELAYLLDALAADPEGFMARGVEARNFGGLRSQADEFGYWGIDPRVFGNVETADTLPVFMWMTPGMSNMAQVVRNVPQDKWSPDTFMNIWRTYLDDGGKAYYGSANMGTVGRVVKGVGDLQRHVQAEMVLNLNPGNWIGNWMGAWATGAYEGYGSFRRTDEFIDQTYNLFNAVPTERLADSLEGKPTGSRTNMVWSESKLFRPAAWLEGLEPIVQNFTPKQNKWAVKDWFEQAERTAENWNPLTTFAWMSDMGNKAWVTMTHVPGTGGRVGFGEAANYWRTYGAAQEDAFNNAVVHAFDTTVGMMVADDVLSASPEGVDAVKRIIEVLPESIDGATSRAGLADRLQSVIAGVQDPAVRARLQTYIGDFILKDYDTTLFASLRTGVKGANNVMLNPEYRKNIDDVMGNFFAFSYFTTRTAGNWAKRIVADPRALGWWARWEAASDQYAEQNEMPIRLPGHAAGPARLHALESHQLPAGHQQDDGGCAAESGACAECGRDGRSGCRHAQPALYAGLDGGAVRRPAQPADRFLPAGRDYGPGGADGGLDGRHHG